MPPIRPCICVWQRLVDLAMRVVDRRDDQVLQHLDVVLRHDLGIDLDASELLVCR